ncbi:MAG: T9SS type A sorting domain-containing protein [Tissierellales bacterium]|nr:T9SS type A sorting domain-containing protein [Tissierellales bacterium]
MLRIKTLLILAITIPSILKSASILNGELSGILTKNNSPYLVSGDLSVPSDEVLIIEAGVEINFNSNGLFVYGELYALGNENENINFKSQSNISGSWRGIIIREKGKAILEHCIIRNAQTGIEVYNSYSNIKDTRIIQCEDYGIYLIGFSAKVSGSIENCYIAGNGIYGIYCEASCSSADGDASPSILGNVLSKNGAAEIYLKAIGDRAYNWTIGITNYATVNPDIQNNVLGDTGSGWAIKSKASGYITQGYSSKHYSKGVVSPKLFGNVVSNLKGIIASCDGTTLSRTHFFVESNTFFENDTTFFFNDGPEAEVVNSIIWNETEKVNIIYDSESEINIKYSDIRGDYEGIGNINENPQFLDNLLVLAPDSPCINSGDSEMGRDPDGSNPDMGAFPSWYYSAKPMLKNPRNYQNEQFTSVELEWDPLPYTKVYDVHVSQNSDFNEEFIFRTSNNKIQLSNLTQNITYYWRVMALKTYQLSAYSETFQFTSGQKMKIPNPFPISGFGSQFYLNDKYMAITSTIGLVHLYEFDGNSWVETDRIFPSRINKADKFGLDLIFDNSTLLIGTPGESVSNNSVGAVHIYKKTYDRWNFDSKINPIKSMENSSFGWHLTQNDKDLFISAPTQQNENQSGGAIYVYRKGNNTYTYSQILIPLAPPINSFGEKVEASQSHLFVLAKEKEYFNAIYVYENKNSNWDLLQILESPKEYKFVCKDIAIFNSIFMISDGYSIHTYSFTGHEWVKSGEIKNSDFKQDQFGMQIAISDPYIFISGNDHQFLPTLNIFTIDNNHWKLSSQFQPEIGSFGDGNKMKLSKDYLAISDILDFDRMGSLSMYNIQQTITGLDEELSQKIVYDFILNPNYPNPFNNSTTISYYLNSINEVNLDVFNILGEKIYNKEIGLQKTGPHEINWKGIGDNNLPVSSGIYFVRLSVGDRSKSLKVSVLR